MDLRHKIRDVKDFPRSGVLFKDITPLLKDSQALEYTIGCLAHPFDEQDVDYVVGIESRGFLFGVSVAHRLNAGFIPVRKSGKLPCETVEYSYELEYGNDVVCIHKDSIKAGDKVVIVDDLIATGGTMKASIELVKSLGADILGVTTLIELDVLRGRQKLEPFPVFSLLNY